MAMNSISTTGRRTRTFVVVTICALLAAVAATARAQSAQQSPAPGEQRVAATPALAGQSVPVEVQQTSVAAVPAARKPPAPRADLYFAERPQPAAVAASLAAGMLVVVLIMAGILLTVRGLREDLRNRKRSYRRRSRRIDARSSRPPAAPAP